MDCLKKPARKLHLTQFCISKDSDTRPQHSRLLTVSSAGHLHCCPSRGLGFNSQHPDWFVTSVSGALFWPPWALYTCGTQTSDTQNN